MRKFFNIWVLLTLGVYYFGPIPWEGAEHWLVGAYVLTCLTAFNIGYMALRRPELVLIPKPFFVRFLNHRALKYPIVILFVLLSASYIHLITGRSIFLPQDYSFEFGEIYSSFIDTQQEIAASGGLARTLLLAKALLFPMALYLFAKEFRTNRLMVILVTFPFLASSMMRGTDKEIVDLAVLFFMMFYAYRMMNRWVVGALMVAPAFLLIFVVRRVARFGGFMPACLPETYVCFDFDGFLATQVSPVAEILYVMLANYTTQGYEGMSIAMELPFDFTWGIGHLPPLKQTFCSILSLGCGIEDFGAKLYFVGWDTTRKWAGVYTTLANDFHWVFVPIYFLFTGLVLRLAEYRWFQLGDASFLPTLFLVAVFFLYSPANMQIAISLDWVMVSLIFFYRPLLFILLGARRRRRAGHEIA